MKKPYITPESDVINIVLTNMIALSQVEGEANPEGEVLSREGGYWGDDDEE